MSIQKNSRVEVIKGPNKGNVGHVEFLYNKDEKLVASIMTTAGFAMTAEVKDLKETN